MGKLNYNLSKTTDILYNNMSVFRMFYENNLIETTIPSTIELLLDINSNKLKVAINPTDRNFYGSTHVKFRWFKDDVFQVENVDDIFYNDILDNMSNGIWTCKVSARFGGIYSQDITSEDYIINHIVFFISNVIPRILEYPYLTHITYDYNNVRGDEELGTTMKYYLSDTLGETSITEVSTDLEYKINEVDIDKYLSVKIIPRSNASVHNTGVETFFQLGQIVDFSGVSSRSLYSSQELIILDAADEVVYDWRKTIGTGKYSLLNVPLVTDLHDFSINSHTLSGSGYTIDPTPFLYNTGSSVSVSSVQSIISESNTDFDGKDKGTISFWYYSTANGNHAIPIGYGDPSSTYPKFGLGVGNRKNRVYINTNMNSVNFTYPSEKWTFITISYDGATSFVYINGKEVYSFNFNISAISSGSAKYGFGGFGGYSWTGSLLGISSLDSCISESQVLLSYSNEPSMLSTQEMIQGESWEVIATPITNGIAGNPINSITYIKS